MATYAVAASLAGLFWTMNQRDQVAARLPPAPANDSRDLWERLTDFAERGIAKPESLTVYEIGQVSFALSLFIATSAEE